MIRRICHQRIWLGFGYYGSIRIQRESINKKVLRGHLELSGPGHKEYEIHGAECASRQSPKCRL